MPLLDQTLILFRLSKLTREANQSETQMQEHFSKNFFPSWVSVGQEFFPFQYRHNAVRRI